MSLINIDIDYFINVSEQVKEFNVNVLKNDIEKSIVINNGTDITNTHKLNNKIIEEFKGKEVYISVGSILPDKGQLELVKAFKIFYDNTNNKNLILILLGRVSSTDYADKIKNFIISNKIGYVYFRECPYEDVNTYLDISETFILASYIEGCSQAIKEAIIKNKKIIITKNVGSNNYLCNNYNNIILIENSETMNNTDDSQKSYFDFLFEKDKSEIVYNLSKCLVESKYHKVIKIII